MHIPINQLPYESYLSICKLPAIRIRPSARIRSTVFLRASVQGLKAGAGRRRLAQAGAGWQNILTPIPIILKERQKTPTVGLEATTTRLRAVRSADWARRAVEKSSSTTDYQPNATMLDMSPTQFQRRCTPLQIRKHHIMAEMNKDDPGRTRKYNTVHIVVLRASSSVLSSTWTCQR